MIPQITSVNTHPLTACSACNKTSEKLLRCSRCWKVAYCSQTCQASDWNLKHKAICQKAERPPSPIKSRLPSPIKTPVNKLIEQITPVPGLRLVENFIDQDVHDIFVREVQKGSFTKLRGLYHEFEIESEAFDNIFEKVVNNAFERLNQIKFFEKERWPMRIYCSILKYDKDGFIGRHIDSPLVSNGSVVVISFNTPVVVNFYTEKVEPKRHIKIFVPPRSMYAITNEARYSWSHEIKSDEDTYEGKKFSRGTRYSLLMSPPGSHVHPDSLMTVGEVANPCPSP